MSQSRKVQYTGLQKAAILCNFLGTENCKKIFENLPDEQLRVLVPTMKSMSHIDMESALDLVSEFQENLEKDIHFSHVAEDQYFHEALGERFGSLFKDGLSHQKHFSEYDLMEPKVLANFLSKEHPQTIAIILVHLNTARRSAVMKLLPDEMIADVVIRMAKIGAVESSILDHMEKTMSKELKKEFHFDTQKIGGVDSVAEMMNLFEQSIETSLMERLEVLDAHTAEAIRSKMFVFEDLIFCDKKGLSILLKDTPQDQLALCLKACSEKLKTKIYSSLSVRSADNLKEEFENLGGIQISKVRTAQSEIITRAQAMIKDGKLIIDRAGNLV